MKSKELSQYHLVRSLNVTTGELKVVREYYESIGYYCTTELINKPVAHKYVHDMTLLYTINVYVPKGEQVILGTEGVPKHE